MALGNQNLTLISDEQRSTKPGMAHFAGTGPAGKTCGDCANRGYYRKREPQFNPLTNEWEQKSYRYAGCSQFNKLTGNHGAVINAQLHACKYFEEIKKK